MKTGFKEPNAIKRQKEEYTTREENDRVWNYKAPHYDNRSSCFINAGTKYGIGHRQPVGHKDNPKMRVDTMPFGRVNTMEVDETR